MKSNLERAQDFAIAQWLSDYPEDMTYAQIIKVLRKDKWSKPDDEWKESITPWYLIEYEAGEHIAKFIEDTCANALRMFD